MKPTSKQLEKINTLSQRPLKAEEVEVHQFLVGNTKVTAYKSLFDRRTLNKFAADLVKGDVAMATLHKTREMLPVGRAFDGRIDEAGNVYGMFYVPKALDTDQVSDRIEMGTIFDVSMGVQVSRYECNICNNDIRNWSKCDHVPGKSYNVGTDEAPVMRECLALMMGTKEVQGQFGSMFEDVNLSETSVVTDGAVPGAGCIAGSFDAETGKMSFGSFSLDKVRAEEGKELSFASSRFTATGKVFLQPAEEADPKDLKIAELEAKIVELGVPSTTVVEDGYKDAFADVLVQYSVKLSGNSFDVELAKKEFTKLSATDALAKLVELQKQVADKFPPGRRTAEEDLSAPKTADDNLNSLFRI